jgi:hypothetical protein
MVSKKQQIQSVSHHSLQIQPESKTVFALKACSTAANAPVVKIRIDLKENAKP